MTLSIMPEESYSCSNCGRGMGEFSAMRPLELYGDIMCGKCIHEKIEAEREEFEGRLEDIEKEI